MGAVVLGRLRPASAASEAVSYFSLFGVSRSHLKAVRGRGLNLSSEVVRGRLRRFEAAVLDPICKGGDERCEHGGVLASGASCG